MRLRRRSSLPVCAENSASSWRGPRVAGRWGSCTCSTPTTVRPSAVSRTRFQGGWPFGATGGPGTRSLPLVRLLPGTAVYRSHTPPTPGGPPLHAVARCRLSAAQESMASVLAPPSMTPPKHCDGRSHIRSAPVTRLKTCSAEISRTAREVPSGDSAKFTSAVLSGRIGSGLSRVQWPRGLGEAEPRGLGEAEGEPEPRGLGEADGEPEPLGLG